MKNKTLVKAAALFVCLAIIGLSVPGLLAADKKAVKFDVRSLLQKPLIALASMFPGLFPIMDQTIDQSTVPSDTPGTGAVVKPTGDVQVGKPSGQE